MANKLSADDLLMLKIHIKNLVRAVIADKQQRGGAETLVDIIFYIHTKKDEDK